VQAGLAPDGGLFVPERIPQADMAVAERLAGESYAALAGYLAELFFGDDMTPGLLRREMERIYDFPLPLRRVGSRYTLELFHGPTFAFKDYGAGFMGRMIGLMGGAGEKLVILTATSGDTGSAVAHGFYGVPGVEVVLLYPEGKISRLQECQTDHARRQYPPAACGRDVRRLPAAGQGAVCRRKIPCGAPRVVGQFDQPAALDTAGILLFLRLLPVAAADGRRTACGRGAER